MKTIKLITLGLLISLFSYGQTDTIVRMVNGTNLNYFNKTMDKIISSTDYYNEEGYKDYKIPLKKSQVLLLHLYDSCKFCDKTISTRTIKYVGRITNNVYIRNVKSSRNVYYVDGAYIKNIIIKRPNE